SKYDYYKIKLARFSIVWMFLCGIIIVSDLGLFYFPIMNLTLFGVAVFLSNTFITPFIFLLITIIFTMLATKTPTSVYMIVTILICIVTFGLSLITRLFIPTPKLNQDNYYKLIQKDSQYLVEKTKTDINLNESIKINTFIPSEWFYSLYSGVFAIDNNISNQNSIFSIRSNRLKETDYSNAITSDVPIMIRESDIDFMSLSNNEYIELICQDIESIINKHRLLNNAYLVLQTTDFINNNFDWNDSNNINQSITNLLIDITGINTEYNQLYYLIKYNLALNFDLDILINNISTRFNSDIADMFRTLIESENTFYNLFKSDNIFNSLDIYPNEYVVNQQKPITLNDSNFIKTSLIKFKNNYIYYLKNDGSYYEFDIKILQDIDLSIVDESSYKKYIDEISLTYK
ncbi:MAG: hypothetical protein K2I49_01285, partial [Ureaplasma sp.]|nr:hypothetical protein [Ureaplasma sp.]